MQIPDRNVKLQCYGDNSGLLRQSGSTKLRRNAGEMAECWGFCPVWSCRQTHKGWADQFTKLLRVATLMLPGIQTEVPQYGKPS